MTGRELILYILQNNLEDEPVFKDDKFIGFITIDEAALKFGVGPATIGIWLGLGIIDGFEINGRIYIPANAIKGVDIK